ncbi:fasciclin domain-containing protein [Novosphingobium sp. PY1]|uniref:fasciclin domain-containing protein n=1 Tax=Novosphingobium sp. PY1 TaxID=1882221 RepID=UPI001A909DC3|nr:fasciclin domain-containing protein [Novosphingobium sp. PY1]GFM28356.1 uncharacterized protein PY1_contig-04-404 [Novosphingobium sp. PY1]
MRIKHLAIALLGGASLATAACSGGTPEDTGTGAAELATPETESLPALLDDADGLQTVAEAIKETGISGIFEGKGSYTLLAPEDAAFAALGDSAKELTGSEDHAALAALLKDHLIPGYLTPQDISAAIDASKDGEVSMPTVSGEELIFTRKGNAISVSAPDGSEATFDGEALAGGSSIAIPLTGILKKI